MLTGTHQVYCQQAIAGAARPHAGSRAFAAWALISVKPHTCALTSTGMNAKARWLQESSQ